MIGIGTPRIQSRSPREKFMTILRVSEQAAFDCGTLSNKDSQCRKPNALLCSWFHRRNCKGRSALLRHPTRTQARCHFQQRSTSKWKESLPAKSLHRPHTGPECSGGGPDRRRKRDAKAIFAAKVLAGCARFLGPERRRLGLGAVGSYPPDHSRQSRRFICDELVGIARCSTAWRSMTQAACCFYR
jgi:hypothetical protein